MTMQPRQRTAAGDACLIPTRTERPAARPRPRQLPVAEASAPTARTKDLPGAHEVAGMPLADFAASELVLEVYSSALDETILVAGNQATVDEEDPRVVYRGSELDLVLGLDDDALRKVHRIKTAFRGTLIPM